MKLKRAKKDASGEYEDYDEYEEEEPRRKPKKVKKKKRKRRYIRKGYYDLLDEATKVY